MKQEWNYSLRMLSKSEYYFIAAKPGEDLELMLRIRNVPNCLEYLKTCPDSIKRIFVGEDRKDFEGANCPRYADCTKKVDFEINGRKYSRCGCCNPGFAFCPKADDIPHYIKLVELGEKKAHQVKK